jgi:hypothetical protein
VASLPRQRRGVQNDESNPDDCRPAGDFRDFGPAAELEVKMLTRGETGEMVFGPVEVQITPG